MKGLLGALVCSACLTACIEPGDGFVEQRLLSMGTWVDIEIESAGAQVDNETLGVIESMLQSFDRDYYAWGDGELAGLNEGLRAGRPVRVSPQMLEVLERSVELSRLSRGNFDPDIADLVALWGFNSEAVAPHRPDASRIDEWLGRHAGIATLRFDEDTVSAAHGSPQIDLGGIAKGEIVERILAVLHQRGYSNALVNAGGDLKVMGQRATHAWRVGIKAPRGTGLLGVIELHDGEAAFTSGDYERYVEADSGRIHHILDPRTGYPATHTRAVTVIADDGVTADAAATALFVAGPDDWREIADALGIRFVLRVDATGRIETTQAMKARLEEYGAGADGSQHEQAGSI